MSVHRLFGTGIMIRLFKACEPSPLIVRDPLEDWTLPEGVVWIDLVEPSRREELAIEACLGFQIPTPEEMAEIEATSRLYRQGDALFITVDLLHHTDAVLPETRPVTFILSSQPLITVRYSEPRAFTMVGDRFDREPELCAGPFRVLAHLFEAVIDRMADVIERIAGEVESVSDNIFGEPGRAHYAEAIKRLGVAQHASARIGNSLSGLDRALSFIQLDDDLAERTEAREHLRSMERDIHSLHAHIGLIAQAVDFQLNAALGLINIEQSGIIKIFSVAAVAFMPPTLIASIYGMNFQHMPELARTWGYPAALAAMVVSAVLPLWYFKKRGWL